MLARRHEYEADLCSSEVATAQTTAEALIKCEVYRLFEAKFRGEFFELMKSQNPPPNYYSEIAASLKAGVQSEDADRWLQSALKVETVGSDTHPSLKDRLSARSNSASSRSPHRVSRGNLLEG